MPDPILERLPPIIAKFRAGEIGLVELQGRLQSSLTALDQSELEIVRELQVLVEELEEIRFTSPESSYRDVVLPKLSVLADMISSALSRGELGE